MLTTLVANLAGRVRYDTYNQRQYVVAPITLIVPGVLSGSLGGLFYPLTELQRSFSLWNGIPITKNHQHNSSDVEKAKLGFVFNTEISNNKLRGEAWFAQERSNAVDYRVVSNIVAGQNIEISTGLHVQVDPTPGDWNGIAFSGIARNHRPHHLAILLDDVGACSVADGRGVGAGAV